MTVPRYKPKKGIQFQLSRFGLSAFGLGLSVFEFRAISHKEGGCEATWRRKFKFPWREAGLPNHHDDKVDSDQQVVNKELSLSG